MKMTSVSRLSDEQIKQASRLVHLAMTMALDGRFDALWASSPPINGRPQREIFFENVINLTAPSVDAELLRRGLHR